MDINEFKQGQQMIIVDKLADKPAPFYAFVSNVHKKVIKFDIGTIGEYTYIYRLPEQIEVIEIL